MAPACASMDMFVNYNARGDAFTDAVRALAGARRGITRRSPRTKREPEGG